MFGAAVGGAQEGGVRRPGDGGGGREPQQEVSFRAFAPAMFSCRSGGIFCSVSCCVAWRRASGLATRSPEIYGPNSWEVFFFFFFFCAPLLIYAAAGRELRWICLRFADMRPRVF
jgi:hypothetical protein